MEFLFVKLIQSPVFFDVAPDPIVQTISIGGVVAIIAVVAAGAYGIFKFLKKKN